MPQNKQGNASSCSTEKIHISRAIYILSVDRRNLTMDPVVPCKQIYLDDHNVVYNCKLSICENSNYSNPSTKPSKTPTLTDNRNGCPKAPHLLSVY